MYIPNNVGRWVTSSYGNNDVSSCGSIFGPWHEISNNVVCATSKGSDQPATRSLIKAFASYLNMNVNLLKDHHSEFLSLKWGCTCSSESSLIKIPHFGNHMSRLISLCNHEQSLKQKLIIYCHQVVVDFHLDFAAWRERSCIMFLKLRYSTHLLTMGCRIHSLISFKAPVIFWGPKFWISIFFGFFKKINIFGGMKFLWIFFLSYHKIGLYLVVISMHLSFFFLRSRYRIRDIFVGCQNFKYFLGCLKFLIFLGGGGGGGGEGWTVDAGPEPTYVWKYQSTLPPPLLGPQHHEEEPLKT